MRPQVLPEALLVAVLKGTGNLVSALLLQVPKHGILIEGLPVVSMPSHDLQQPQQMTSFGLAYASWVAEDSSGLCYALMQAVKGVDSCPDF